MATSGTSALLPLNEEDEAVEGSGRCFRVKYQMGIGIRDRPSTDPRWRTGSELKFGEVFEVVQEVRKGGRRYFELLDGRGWIFDWAEVEGERMELLELAAELYTVNFPDGVSGIVWSSDTTMRFCKVKEFASGADEMGLRQAGIREEDYLVMIDQDPVVGMPMAKVLERVWASRGQQPGQGTFYKVVTDGPYGIGVRAEPDKDGPRTGQDLIRGTIFEVDEIVEEKGKPTYLHLADDSGWVFDMRPVEPESDTVMNLDEVEPGCTCTMWRGSAEDLAETIGLKFKQDGKEGRPFTITVLEEGQPIQKVPVEPGANLRKALVDAGFQIYQDFNEVLNCGSQSLCGTCVLAVLEGDDALTAKSVNEKRAMSSNPPNYRLSCNIDIYGDVAVRIRPQGVKYGGPTA